MVIIVETHGRASLLFLYYFPHFRVDGLLHDVVNGLAHFRAVADEPALRDFDFAAHLHQRHPFEVRLSGFLELGPEVFLHFGGHGDGSAIVVDGGVRFRRSEDDAVAGYAGAHRAAQLARLGEVRCRAVALLRPRLGEESAPLEVAVELVEQLHADVSEYLVDHYCLIES